ncbi:alpha/beta fold hydrolase [Paraburkholderia sp. BL10I2N1]|uniref:alpha/beta fold hydrolase n=1 Tax=Paraburkholderia sp. BL10I2N1 TaxID=1938796 RepID=UPI00105E0C67|nr:alpha/beta fold hydrolase [Paraburkholderia sp. BL10I2N1]
MTIPVASAAISTKTVPAHGRRPTAKRVIKFCRAIRLDAIGRAMTKTIRCKWDRGEISLDVDEAGSGASVVLLPALSSISTRLEMHPLFDGLVPQFHVVTVDWPGFGGQARPKEEWSPELLLAFLNWFLSHIVAPPHAIVAAGHAATYALYQAVLRPGTIDRLVLVAPM